VHVWVSACFNFAGFVFMLLTLLAWILCVAVFLSVAILFLPVSWSDGIRSAVGVFLPVCLLTCSLVAWVSPCWFVVFCRIACCLLAVACVAGCWLAFRCSFGLQGLWCGGAWVLCCWLMCFWWVETDPVGLLPICRFGCFVS